MCGGLTHFLRPVKYFFIWFGVDLADWGDVRPRVIVAVGEMSGLNLAVEYSREEQCRFAKHFDRAQGWFLLDKFERAMVALEEIPLAFQGRAEVVLFRAQLFLAAGQWTRAEPVLRQLLKEEPNEPQYWINLAFAVRRAKSIGDAEPILREASSRFPTVALIWFNLACYAAQRARLNEAGELLKEALRLEPELKAQAKADADLAPYWASQVAEE